MGAGAGTGTGTGGIRIGAVITTNAQSVALLFVEGTNGPQGNQVVLFDSHSRTHMVFLSEYSVRTSTPARASVGASLLAFDGAHVFICVYMCR
jgi:hypothetical protein